jgi:hypothetical protein
VRILVLVLLLVGAPARADLALGASAAEERACSVEEWRGIKRAVREHCARNAGNDCERIRADLKPWYWAAASDDEADRRHAAACTLSTDARGRYRIVKSSTYVFSGRTWRLTAVRRGDGWRVLRARFADEPYE